MPTFTLENELEKSIVVDNYSVLQKSYIIVGVDEVGYGCLAGPVVAAAVYFPQKDENIIIGINDSKKLSPKKREALFSEIHSYAKCSIGIATVKEIDKYNILVASHMAIKRALYNIQLPINYVLVDGNKSPNLPWNIKTVINGDNISISIAAASIIAKVTRDRMMKEIHKLFPCYFWNENKGYGTKNHLRALNTHGPCVHHRKFFKPVSKAEETFKHLE